MKNGTQRPTWEVVTYESKLNYNVNYIKMLVLDTQTNERNGKVVNVRHSKSRRKKKPTNEEKNVKLSVVRHRVFYGVSHSSQPVINILTLFHLVLFNRIDEIFKPRITVFKSSNSNANPIWEAHHVSAAIPFLQISRRAHFLVFSPLLIWMNNRHGITNLNRLC